MIRELVCISTNHCLILLKDLIVFFTQITKIRFKLELKIFNFLFNCIKSRLMSIMSVFDGNI